MTNLQDIVVNEMKVKKHIDSEQESREIIQFIKSYVQSHSFIKSFSVRYFWWSRFYFDW